MKAILKTIFGAAIAFSAASCGSTSDPYYGNRNPNGGVYRDGTVYRDGQIYRDRDGNVYRNGQIVRRGDNVYRTGKPLPPGQAKKVYGGEAKDYAPGQVKKRNKYYGREYREDRDWDRRDGAGNRKDHRFRDKKGKGKNK